jgi:hypothetical protein
MRLISREFIDKLKRYSNDFGILSNNIVPIKEQHLLYNMCLQNSKELDETIKYIETTLNKIEEILEEQEEIEKTEEYTGLKLVIDNSYKGDN